MSNSPLKAPRVVATSRTTASLILVVPLRRKGAAPPHEPAMTDTMLTTMAAWISRCPNVVSMGTMKIPLAIPSAPPKALAPKAAANIHATAERSIIETLDAGRLATGETGLEPDQISAIVELLVIDGPITDGIGGALNQKYRASYRNPQFKGNQLVGGRRLQVIVRLHQWNVVTLLEQSKDRIYFEIMRNDLPSDGKWQICFVEGHADSVSQTNPLNPHDIGVRRQAKMPSDVA